MEEINFKQLIGKRFLSKIRYGFIEVIEHVLLEMSPSGDYLKLQLFDGRTCWLSISDYHLKYDFIEPLLSVEKPERNV